MKKSYKRFRSDVEKGLSKVTVTLSEDLLGKLFRFSKAMKFCGGYKLPRTYVIRAMLKVCLRLPINLKGVKTEKELEGRIAKAISVSLEG